jgi:hypothetical protein
MNMDTIEIILAILLVAILFAVVCWLAVKLDGKKSENEQLQRNLAIERVKREFGITDAKAYDDYENLWRRTKKLMKEADAEFEAAKKVKDEKWERYAALRDAVEDIRMVAAGNGLPTYNWQE